MKSLNKTLVILLSIQATFLLARDVVYEVGEKPYDIVRLKSDGEGMRRPNTRVSQGTLELFEKKPKQKTNKQKPVKKDQNSNYTMSPVAIKGRYAEPALQFELPEDPEIDIRYREPKQNSIEQAARQEIIQP